jgi:cytochrome c oxidase subunit 4
MKPNTMHHIIPIRVYFMVYAALLVLLVLTWAVAQFQLGPLNNAVALTIAIIKATMVLLFFMGVKYSTRLTWVWAGAGFLWLMIMFGIITDYISRGWIPVKGW